MNKQTIVLFEDGTVEKVDLKKLAFIPNHSPDIIKKLLATPEEETVEILYSRSAYETRKNHVNKIKSGEFKYPCVCNVDKSEECTLIFSNTKKYGHFGVSKLICGSASSGSNFFVDKFGKFGITQFSFGIVDDPDNLDNLKKALKSKKFQLIIEAIPNFSAAINHKVLSLFRKDFWKEFV